MKLQALNLVFALLFFVNCCRAGLSFGSSADYVQNLRSVVDAANEAGPLRNAGTLVATEPWIPGAALEYEVLRTLHAESGKYAIVGTIERRDRRDRLVDTYNIYGRPLEVTLPGHQARSQRIFLFGLGVDGHYAPFGWAKYQTGGFEHAHNSFLQHAKGLDVQRDWSHMHYVRGFPPVQ
ncbi:hypothetical protein EX895_003336 [Sporisorium graminicola]|uniref:Uncharacterized protein n=1 Tax=Sporisorium graminicola TaxID=280036 RepID=A0A4U7KT37_9BASI|nr:hypothetical protein EX895_003336 [Sporisorium graminicola]TKY87755.1 hypothetical protein EX895_003336 [Sporisorium graminicola]